MAHTTLNRRQTSSVRQQRRWYLLLPLLATLIALVGPAMSHKLGNGPYSGFNSTKVLKNLRGKWMSPCGTVNASVRNTVNVQYASSFNQSTISTNKITKFLNMESQITLTMLDLSYWNNSKNSVTTWNDTRRKRHFRFLQPFLKNQSSWERRLSVYWAYVKLIREFNKKYPETNIDQKESDALERVNEATQQLLCMVQEYRSVTKRRNKLIGYKQMAKLTNFSIKDAAEIKIHIWYLTCRLKCFLDDMRKHLRYLSAQVSEAPVDTVICDTCPYWNKQDEQDEQGIPPTKKQRKQQQRKQQRKHNGTGHSGQQRKAKQQQTTRQPRGRKGTQKLNNRLLSLYYLSR